MAVPRLDISRLDKGPATATSLCTVLLPDTKPELEPFIQELVITEVMRPVTEEIQPYHAIDEVQ